MVRMARTVVTAGVAIVLAGVLSCTEEDAANVYRLDKVAVQFNSVWKSAVPGTKTVRLSATESMPQTLTFSVQYPAEGSDWLQAVTARDGQDVVISNSVTPAALAPGSYAATVTVTAAEDPALSVSYDVNLKVHACSLFIIAEPVAGWEDSVDAVTQASDVLGGARVSVTQVPDPSDSVKDVVVSFGDGTNKSWLDGRFPVGAGLIGASIWYVKTDPVKTLCTLSTVVTTYGGKTADTSIVINVIDKDQH